LSKIHQFYTGNLGQYVTDTIFQKLEKFCKCCTKNKSMIVSSAGGFNFLNCFQMHSDNVALHVYKGDILPNESSCDSFVITERASWPYRAESVDRVICIHDIEFAEKPDVYMREIWRVLKGEGQLLLVLPNRAGGWARKDNTPFGQGYPFSPDQIEKILSETHFQIDKVEGALYFPPYEPKIRIGLMYRIFIEKIGAIFMLNAGVLIIHASKHIYAPTKGIKVVTAEKAREFIVGNKQKVTTGRSLKEKS
jgi:SAM-dependent methyltransferase